MVVVSFKDYAKQNNISYEAVRKQVARYKDELKGHLIKEGRQQFLDEEAVAFLDQKRQQSPIAIIQQDKDEEIEKLRGDLDAAKTLIIALQQREASLMEEKHALALENARIALLEADNEAARVKAAQAEENAQKAQQELVDAHAAFEAALADKDREIEQLRSRKWYELLFKKKEK